MVIKEQHDEGVDEVGIVSKLRPSVIPTNPDINSLCRKIKIQTGVVSRLIKDHSFYVADSEKALSKLEDMKDRSCCPHDIKQASEVFVESKKMIPHVLVELESALGKLSNISEECDIPESSETLRDLMLEARSVIERAKTLLQEHPCNVPKLVDSHESDSSDTEY